MDVLDWTLSVLEESNRALDRSAPDESLRLLDDALGRLAGMEASVEVRAEAEALLLRNRGRTWRVKGEPRRALADYDAVAECLVPLQSPARTDLAFVLARLHNNRANACNDLGQTDEAIAAYDLASDSLPPSDPAHPEWEGERVVFLGNRANACLSRDNTSASQGGLAEAVADYDRAIVEREGLRAQLEPAGQWSPGLRNDLAGAYRYRGLVLGSQGRLAEAVADFDRAIAEREGLRVQLESAGQWSPGLRNDLAGAYMDRGLALDSQGRLAEAVADYERAIAEEGPHGQLDPAWDWRQVLRDALAQAYMKRGNALNSTGRLAEVVADYGRAVAELQALRALLEPRGLWTPARRRALAAAYSSRGMALASHGRLVEAVADFDRAITEGEGLRALLETQEEWWSPALRNVLVTSYAHRGQALSEQGRLAEAVADSDRAITEGEGLRAQLEPAGPWPPGLRNALAAAYLNRGNARNSQGRLAEAVADYDRAITEGEGLRAQLEPAGRWSPRLRNALAEAYLNRGNARNSQGRLPEALADSDRAITEGEGLRAQLEAAGQWSPELRNTLAAAYMNRGNARNSQGRLAEAVADYDQAIAEGEGLRAVLEPQDEWSPWSRNHLAAAYSNRGLTLDSQGRLAEALADYDRAIALNEPLPDGVLAAADRLRFTLYANLALLLDRLPDPFGWVQAKSRRMATLLERVPATGTEQSNAPELYRHFALFHARWLAWCVRSGHLELIPEILAIVQGRELAAEVLDQLNLEDSRTPAEVRAFHELRLKLRKLNARIEAVIAGGRLGGGDGPGGSGRAALSETAAWDPATYTTLVAEHHALVEQLPALRRAAARVPGYEYLEFPYQRLDLAELQGHLAHREALVLLIHPPEGESGVLVVRPQGTPQWRPVGELPDLVQQIRAFEHRGGRLRGYRRGRAELTPDAPVGQAQTAEPIQKQPEVAPGGVVSQLVRALPQVIGRSLVRAESTAPPPEVSPRGQDTDAGFWGQMADALHRHLWAGLEPHLRGIDQVTVIPHGELHLLPLAAGAPAGLTLSRYPGLAFFAQRRGLYGDKPVPAAAADSAVGLIGFAGPKGDIPLAEAEVAALAGLYRAHGARVYHPSGYPREAEPAGLLHIACHGGTDPARADPEHPEHEGVALFIAKGDPSDTRHVLNQDAIVTSPTLPRDLYFSACLGGQTVEGLSGTPSGLVSACFRRNARWVAGALVSIPDQWAMILALLTHQAILNQALTLPAALAEGKRRLASGDWYADTGERLRGVLGEPLRRLAATGVQGTWDALWGYNDPAERRRQFCEQVVPFLLQGWGDLTAAEIADLHQRLRHHGPETLAEPLAAALTELWPSRPRIPPEPALGTLIHGLVVFGEAAP